MHSELECFGKLFTAGALIVEEGGLIAVELGDCDRIGKGARFYDPQPKRPGIKKYKSWLTKNKNDK